MVKKLIFVLLLQFVAAVVLGKTFHCTDNSTKLLGYNEIGFYATPNYPTPLTLDNILCNFKFFIENKNLTQFIAFVALSYYYGSNDWVPQTVYQTFNNPLNVSVTNDIFEALQGIIIFDTGIDHCPMETISKNIPFQLQDETQIFYIQSSFYENKLRMYPCQWRFMAPDDEYGFKIVFQKFNVSDSTKLLVKNSTDIILNHRGIKLNYPYYNSDLYLEINLSEGDSNFIVDMELRAYISVVRKNVQKKDIHCFSYTLYHVTTWRLNMEEEVAEGVTNGYNNNEYCNFTLFMPKGTTYIANVKRINLEVGNADYIKYYYDDEEGILVPEPLKLVFDPYTNGSDRYVKWEFVSDGSLPGIGFYIEFYEMEICKCNNYEMYCNEEYYLMPTDNDYYCDNLKCKFEIIGCTTALTQLSLTFVGGVFLNDRIRIISNGQLVKEITSVTASIETVNIYLESNNSNILEVETYRSITAREMRIYTNSFIAPEIDEYITLSQNYSMHFVNLKNLNFTVINVSDNLQSQNYTITIISNFAYGVGVYSNPNLTHSLINQKCFREPNIYTCEVNSNEVAIYFTWEDYDNIFFHPFLAITLSVSHKECVMKQNLFFVKDDMLYITGIATTEECYIYILIENKFTYYISHLWTTSTTDNVKIFIGLDQTRLYFEYNAKSANKWQKIGIHSKVYTVVIPPKAAIYIILASYKNNEQSITYPYQSIFTSPFYGTNKYDYSNEPQFFIAYNLTNSAAKFTVLNYKIKTDDFYFYTGQWEYRTTFFINKTGDILIFENQNIYLDFKWRDENDNEDNYGALILVEIIKNPKTKKSQKYIL